MRDECACRRDACFKAVTRALSRIAASRMLQISGSIARSRAWIDNVDINARTCSFFVPNFSIE